MTNKNVLVGLIVVAIIAIGGYMFPKVAGVAPSFSGMPFLETQYFQKGVAIGDRATVLKKVYTGTCSLVTTTSVAATSTGTATCATTGSLAGDQVFISLATTTTKIAAQWVIVGTVAGTDTTTVRLLNLTGTAGVPSATNGFGSSTPYYFVRD